VGFGLLAGLLAVLASGLFFEVALRILGIGYGNVPFDPHPVLHHVNPRHFQYISFSPMGEYGGFPVQFDGERRRVLPVSPPSQPTHRFALLGDSFAAGLEVAAEDSLAGQLARRGEGRTEVRNYGVTGYSPILEELQWGQEVIPYRPTHVLLLLYCNDPVDDEGYLKKARRNPQGEVVAVPNSQPTILITISRSSYLARFIRKQLAVWRHRNEPGPEVGGFGEPNRPLDGLSAEAVRRLSREVRASGAEFLLAAVPSKALLFGAVAEGEPVFSRLVRQWAQREGVDYLDLDPDFAAASRQQPLYFPKDIHWNRAGHRVAAEAVARRWPELFPRQP